MVAWLSRRQLLAALLAALGGWLGRRHRPRPASATPAPDRSRWRPPPFRRQLALGPTDAGRLTVYYYDGRNRQVASKQGGPHTDDTTPQPPISYTTDTTTHWPITYTTYDHPGAAIEPRPYDGDAESRPERQPGTVAT
jgi:hypothetical protein